MRYVIGIYRGGGIVSALGGVFLREYGVSLLVGAAASLPVLCWARGVG